jgi:hypothetical protein
MAYQSHHCSATLLCSACISVSLLASAALSVLLSYMHLCSFLLLCFMLCVFFPFYAPCLFCALQLLHTTCFYPHESLSTTSHHLFSVLHFYILYAPTAFPHNYIANSKNPLHFFVLHLFVMSSPLLDHHGNSSSSLVVSSMRSSSLVIMLRFLSFSGNRDSSSSLSQLSLSSLLQLQSSILFPSVNRLYVESSFHWKLPQDSSASLAITLRFFEFSGRCNQSFSAVTISLSLAVTERTSVRSCLWYLFPFLRNLHSGC